MSDGVEWAIHCCTVLGRPARGPGAARPPGWPSSTTCRPPTSPRPSRRLTGPASPSRGPARAAATGWPGRRRDHAARRRAGGRRRRHGVPVPRDPPAGPGGGRRAGRLPPPVRHRPGDVAGRGRVAGRAGRARRSPTSSPSCVATVPADAAGARAPSGSRRSTITTEEPNMKIFLTGAPASSGTRALPRLVAAGHEVTAVARSPRRPSCVRSLGGRRRSPSTCSTPARCAPRSTAARGRHPPGHQHPAAHQGGTGERLGHQRPAPHARRPTTSSTRALDAGVDALVQESISFPYVDGGDRVDRRGPARRPRRALQRRVARRRGRRRSLHRRRAARRGAALRPQFYAADSPHTARASRRHDCGCGQPVRRRRRRLRPVDPRRGRRHRGGRRARRAGRHLQRRPTSRLTRPEAGAAVAEAFGVEAAATPCRGAPQAAADVGQAADALAAGLERRLQGGHGLGARPTRRIRGLWPATRRHDPLRQVALVVIAGGSLRGRACGRRASRGRSTTTSPASAGCGWPSTGPYNEHLVRDVGGLNLALAFVAVLALVTGSVAGGPRGRRRRAHLRRARTSCTTPPTSTPTTPATRSPSSLAQHRRPGRRPRRHARLAVRARGRAPAPSTDRRRTGGRSAGGQRKLGATCSMMASMRSRRSGAAAEGEVGDDDLVEADGLPGRHGLGDVVGRAGDGGRGAASSRKAVGLGARRR